MKSFFILSTLLIFLAGCSEKNAFSEFDMSKKQELTVSNLQSSKLTNKKGDVAGIVSVVYLNEVYPYYFSGNEYFFIYMYLKDSKDSQDKTGLSIKMNGEKPLRLKKLSKVNNFTHLVDVKSEWNKYYLATFTKSTDKIKILENGDEITVSGDNINLVFESDLSSSAVLKYQKDQE